MSFAQILFALFLFVPILEIYLLMEVGGIIGALPTVLLVVLTAIIGAALVRAQGISTLMRAQESMARGEVPATAVFEGAFLLVAGALLLTPGFFTDGVGFACLVPVLRQKVIHWGMARMVMQPGMHAGFHAHTGQGPSTLEGEFKRENGDP